MVKKWLLILICTSNILLFAQNINGNIKEKLCSFLISVDSSNINIIKPRSVFLYDCNREKIIKKEHVYFLKDGLYLFTTLNPHSYGHFLLCINRRKYIINMMRPLNSILDEVDKLLINSKFGLAKKLQIIENIKRAHYSNWSKNGKKTEEYNINDY